MKGNLLKHVSVNGYEGLCVSDTSDKIKVLGKDDTKEYEKGKETSIIVHKNKNTP